MTLKKQLLPKQSTWHATSITLENSFFACRETIKNDKASTVRVGQVVRMMGTEKEMGSKNKNIHNKKRCKWREGIKS